MKIVYLVVADIDSISGGLRVIFEHVNRLSERKHKVEIWVRGKVSKPYFSSSVQIKEYDFLEVSKPDIVVMTDPIFIPEVCSNRKKSGTFLLMQHDIEWLSEVTGYPGFGNLLREHKDYFRNGACKIIVVSSWLNELVQTKYGLDSYLIKNGIDKELFHPDTPILRTENPVSLTFYDPQEWKGFETAILALYKVKESKPDMEIMVIGKYFPKTPDIRGRVYGIPHSTIYFNRPEQRNLSKILSSADVLVAASWKEGFGLPMLEAMACGVPVVTTDAGGNRDFSVNEQTALVSPQKDISGLAHGVTRILEDKKLSERLTKNGINMARNFSWDNSINKLVKLFEIT